MAQTHFLRKKGRYAPKFTPLSAGRCQLAMNTFCCKQLKMQPGVLLQANKNSVYSVRFGCYRELEAVIAPTT